MIMSFDYEVKICEENVDILARDICAIENGANHGIINPCILSEITKTLDDRLSVSKESLVGSCIDIDYNASDFLAMYKQPPNSTQITLVYKSDGWYLVNIRRATIRKAKDRYHYNLTKEAHKELLEHLQKGG